MSRNDWLGFEKLAEKIFTELHSHAEVQHNDRIYGHISRKHRQIDVSIRANLDQQDILVIVQAKNWSKPADIKIVDGFASVVRDVQATKGILICRSGFTKTTYDYALNLGIELLNLHDAQSKDWNLEIKLPVLWIEEHPIAQLEFGFQFDKQYNVPLDHKNLPFFSQDGGKTAIEIWPTIENLWNTRQLPTAVGVQHTFIGEEIPVDMIVNDDGKIKWILVNDLKVVYEVEKKVSLGFFHPKECRGIWNYLNNAFRVTYLPIGQLPDRPETGWIAIKDEAQIAIRTNATLVVCEGWEIKFGPTKFNVIKIDD